MHNKISPIKLLKTTDNNIDIHTAENKTSSSEDTAAPYRHKRKTQARSLIVREKLVAVATPLFSEFGYDAISVKDIESAANLKRGSLLYHFHSKQEFWKASADSLFNLIKEQRRIRMAVLRDVAPLEGVAMLIRFNIRMAAQYPEIGRFIAQEARTKSWRLEYIVDTHVKPGCQSLKKYLSDALHLDDTQFVHWYYIMFSAAGTIYTYRPECQLLFDLDCQQEHIINAHTEILVDMLLGKHRQV